MGEYWQLVTGNKRLTEGVFLYTDVRGRTSVTIGPMVDTMLAGIDVSNTLLSVAGVAERGFFNSDTVLVESEKAMIASADQTIVSTDHIKFAIVGLCRIYGLQDVNRLVTDAGTGSKWDSLLESAGVELILADTAAGAGLKLSEAFLQNNSGVPTPLSRSTQSGSSISS